MLVRLLRWLSDASCANAIVGDLDEERARRTRVSTLTATVWFWRSGIGIAVYFAARRIADAVSAGARAITGWSNTPQELGQSVRALRRTPWYSATVVGVIALTMTLSTTVFTVADGVLFKPLPYPQPAELHTIAAPFGLVASMNNVREWQAAVPEIRMAMFQGVWVLGTTIDGTPMPVTGTGVGPGFFEVLGQHPMIGGFRDEHFIPTTGRVPILISHGIWQRSFGGSLDVIGRPFDLTGAVNHLGDPFRGFEVVGVLPRDFLHPDAGRTPDVLLPIALTPEQQSSRNWSYGVVLTRLSGPMTAEQIEPRLTAVAATQGFRDSNADLRPPGLTAPTLRVRVRRLDASLGFGERTRFLTAFVAATVILMLSLLNVAALGIARSRQRAREIAVRQALGARRAELFRSSILDVAPLVLLGAAIGLALTPPSVSAFVALLDANTPLLKVPEIDWRVASFVSIVGATMIAVVSLASLRVLPASSVGATIGRGESVTPRRGRWSSIVVAVQMALVFVLTVAGSLVIGSLWWAFRQDPGFSPGQTAVVDLSAGAGTLAERNDRFRIAVARLRELPGVTHVGVVAGPFLRRGWRVPPLNDPALRREQLVTVGGDFFEMLGLGAIEGRLPTPQELSSSAPVAVVSDRIARRMWPGETAVGRVLAGSSFQYQVIGVVPDARFSGLDDSSRGQIYWPIGSGLGSTILVAGATPGDETLRRVLEAIRAAGPASGVTRATTVDRTFTELLRRRLFVAWFYGLFAASALVIVGVGILGLVAMSTAARTREIGIRSSLGATGDRLVRGLVAEQLAPVAAGLAMGGVIAAWAVTYLRSTLYEFSIYDTRLWSIAAAALLLTATVGALIPAVRAARIDPVRALRTD